MVTETATISVKAKILKPRKVQEEIEKELESALIIVLLGSRQTGKTSLMSLLINFLRTRKKVNDRQIAYFDLEIPRLLSQIEGLYGEEFLTFLSANGVDVQKKSFVFIDEIQHLKNPTSFLKIIHDHFPQIKLIISGSSSLEIKKKFKESLAGRKRIFEIMPLDFEEILSFKEKGVLLQEKKKLSLKKVVKNGLPNLDKIKFLSPDFCHLFEEYTIFGGYPAVVLENDYERKKLLLSEINASYIQKDIRNFGQIEKVSAFNKLIELLSFQIGNLVNVQEITNSLEIARETVENYLFLLEKTYIVNLVKPFFTNKRKEIIKQPKVYFYDSGLRNYLAKNFDFFKSRGDKGGLLENVVFSQLYQNRQLMEEVLFWRTKTKIEVDFISREKEIIPIEVKFKSKKESIPSSLRSFIKIYSPKAAVIVNFDSWGKLMFKKTPIYLIPAWAI